MIKSHGLFVVHDAVASLPMIDTGTLSEQLSEVGDWSVKNTICSTLQDAIGLIISKLWRLLSG